MHYKHPTIIRLYAKFEVKKYENLDMHGVQILVFADKEMYYLFIKQF